MLLVGAVGKTPLSGMVKGLSLNNAFKYFRRAFILFLCFGDKKAIWAENQCLHYMVTPRTASRNNMPKYFLRLRQISYYSLSLRLHNNTNK